VAFEKHEEHLERLRMQLDADPLPAKLSMDGIRFKYSEAIATSWLWVRHIVHHFILP
jgi:hypothetical protein